MADDPLEGYDLDTLLPLLRSQKLGEESRGDVSNAAKFFGNIVAPNLTSYLTEPAPKEPNIPPDYVGKVPPKDSINPNLVGAISDIAGMAIPEAKGALAMKAMIAGPLARTANMAAYHEAMGRLLAGGSPLKAYERTGWFPRAENQLAFEIPDKDMKVYRLPKLGKDENLRGTFGGFVNHPRAFEAYPDLEKLNVIVDPEYGSGGGAIFYPKNSVKNPYYKPGEGGVVLGGLPSRSGLTPEQQSALLHEGQHFIQNREGWTYGGGSKDYSDLLTRKLDLLQDILPPDSPRHEELNNLLNILHGKGRLPEAAFQMYWRHPGEVEARNVQHRFGYGRYDLPPWQTEDTPRDQQFNYWKHLVK
jgi:hypothetical protein